MEFAISQPIALNPDPDYFSGLPTVEGFFESSICLPGIFLGIYECVVILWV